MFVAHIVCSDPDCWEEREISVSSLEELDGLVCECGHGFVLLSVSERTERPGQVIPIRIGIGARTPDRRAA